MAEELSNDLRLQRSTTPTKIERKIYQPEEDIDSAESTYERSSFRGGIVNKILILTVAFILDIISLIPAVNDATIIVADIIFISWFYFSGVKFSPRRIISFGATNIIEVIPYASAVPMILINVAYCLYSSNEK